MKKTISIVLTILLLCNVFHSLTLEIADFEILRLNNESLSGCKNVTSFCLNVLHFKLTLSITLEKLNEIKPLFNELQEMLKLVSTK